MMTMASKTVASRPTGALRGVSLLAITALATIALAGCTASASDPETVPGDSAGGGTALAGTLTGLLIQVSGDSITLDEIEVLSGEEAAAARQEDGQPPVEEGLDVPYVRNPTPEAYEIPVATGVRVQVFDCKDGCRLVNWNYEDLVSDAALPYGSLESPFTVTVNDGQVVGISEVYLP
jgi:hypothetical protein